MSKIPGFRSDKRWKKVIATIGYLFIALIIYSIAKGGNNGTSAPTTSPVKQETKSSVTTGPAAQKTWKEKIKEVSTSEGTPTEKFDNISSFANVYKPTGEEIKEFGEYIIREYKAKTYIKDISNHEYMLENIFKSQVVEKHSDEGNPIKKFAFDFWQNSKYNYRGVDTPTSEATLSNERQMNKALKEMGK